MTTVGFTKIIMTNEKRSYFKGYTDRYSIDTKSSLDHLKPLFMIFLICHTHSFVSTHTFLEILLLYVDNKLVF